MSDFELFQRLSHVNYPDGGLVWMGMADPMHWRDDDKPACLVLPLGVFEDENDHDRRRAAKLRIPAAELAVYSPPIKRNTRNLAAFFAMCRAAVEHGWPKNYADDLFHHDALHLGVHPRKVQANEVPDGTPFGWILRENGTEFCRAEIAWGDSPASYWARQEASRTLAFWWDGGKLERLAAVRDIETKMGEYRDAKAGRQA